MFKAPDKEEFEDEPYLQQELKNGSVMRVYKHKTDAGRRRITYDGKPYNPNKVCIKSNGK